MSNSLRPHEPQQAMPPCPSPTPPNSYPLSWWCHLTISSSAVPFSFCLQYSPTSRSLPVKRHQQLAEELTTPGAALNRGSWERGCKHPALSWHRRVPRTLSPIWPQWLPASRAFFPGFLPFLVSIPYSLSSASWSYSQIFPLHLEVLSQGLFLGNPNS